MKIVLASIITAIATGAFGIYFNAPKRAYKYIIVISFVSSLTLSVLKDLSDNIYFSTLMASLLLGVLAELSGRLAKMPATIFSIPACLPFVPGAAIYFMMYNMVQQNMSMMLKYAKDTAILAACMAFGLLISSILSRSIKFRKLKLEQSEDHVVNSKEENHKINRG